MTLLEQGAKSMKTMNFALAVALASALSTSTQTWAQSKAPLPREQHRGAVTWISGGIGKDAADAMRAVASRYNVRLVLAVARKPSAAFLGAVPVRISDAKKRVVLDIKTDGPLLFLKLPPGRYTVRAEVGGPCPEQVVAGQEQRISRDHPDLARVCQLNGIPERKDVGPFVLSVA